MKKIVMSRSGRLTLPIETRRCLGLEGETAFEVEVDTVRNSIILRPTLDGSHEDAWAYTPAHRKLLAQAYRDSREGRVYRMTESGLARLGE